MTTATAERTYIFTPNLAVGRVGLDIIGEPTLQECEDFCKVWPRMERLTPFILGDFINYVEAHFGEEASQLLDASFGWAEGTLRNYSWVCDHVARDVRREELSFKQHRLVANLPRAQQVKWLERAASGDENGPWNYRHMRAAIKAGTEPEVIGWALFIDCGSEKIRREVEEMLAGKVMEMKHIDRLRRGRPKKEAA